MEHGNSPTTTPVPDHTNSGNSNGNNGNANHDVVGKRARSGSASSFSSATHKRGISTSLFSKLSLMRMNQGYGNDGENAMGAGEMNEGRGGINTGGGSGGGGRAMASALQQQIRTRRRKGSLRKTALLGTGVLRMSQKGLSSRAVEVSRDAGSREGEPEKLKRNDNGLAHFPELQSSIEVEDKDLTTAAAARGSQALEIATPIALKPPTPSVRPSQQLAWLHHEHEQEKSLSLQPGSSHSVAEPLSAPSSHRDDATTDDEDLISFPPLTNTLSRLSSSSSISAISSLPPRRIPLKLPTTPSPNSDSYFPTPSISTNNTITTTSSSAAVASTNIIRTMSQSHPRVRSPLATNPAELAPSLEGGWDYSETEWWGWIILLVTWVVFVVGMGSCLGVWSWAWDVGETPYAPPELEDDATLPIVGYYPALIILTAVMAWVWVVVAWVGMKYFRHANITG